MLAPLLPTSVTRWLDYVSIFGLLQRRYLTQKLDKFAMVGLTFYQIRNKQSIICQILVNFRQIWSHCSQLPSPRYHSTHFLSGLIYILTVQIVLFLSVGPSVYLTITVIRLGYFWRVLVSNFLINVAQIPISWLLELLWKTPLLCKTCCFTLVQIWWKIWLL